MQDSGRASVPASRSLGRFGRSFALPKPHLAICSISAPKEIIADEHFSRSRSRPPDDGAGGREVSADAIQRARWANSPPDPGDVRHLRPRQCLRHGAGARGMRPGPALLPALQRAVDGPHGHRLRQGKPAPGDTGLHVVDRAWLDQHDHRRGRGDDQPPAGAAVPVRLLRDPAPGAGAPAARASRLGGLERQRLLPAGQPLLRPHHPSRADL